MYCRHWAITSCIVSVGVELGNSSAALLLGLGDGNQF